MNRLTTVLFIVYLLALCWILLFKLGVQFSYMDNRNVNLIPFREALLYGGKVDVSETVSNAIIFIPLGIYTGILFYRWTVARKLLLFFVVSLLVEGLQFVLAIGAFDSTDIVTNTAGGIIGWLIYKGIEKLFSNNGRAQRFINWVAFIGTVLMLVLLLLLKLNKLPIRYQ
ncbi:MAG: VanZ family protein [Bacteroidota bacterium]|nr:VanZ family protein [Bacteroidota bacterium]